MNNLGKHRIRITDSANHILSSFVLLQEAFHFPPSSAKPPPFSFTFYELHSSIDPSFFTPRLGSQSDELSINYESEKRKHRDKSSLNHTVVLHSVPTSPIDDDFIKSESVFTPRNVNQDSVICMDLINSLLSSNSDYDLTFDSFALEQDFQHMDAVSSVLSQNSDVYSTDEKDCSMELDDLGFRLTDTYYDNNNSEYHDLTDNRIKKSVSLISKLECDNLENTSEHDDTRRLTSIASCSIIPFSRKKGVMPRRYVKWKKSTPCLSMSRSMVVDQQKHMRSQSHPNLTRRFGLQSVVTPASGAIKTKMRKKKGFFNALRHKSSFFSKLSEIALPSTFKQHMPVNSKCKGTENDLSRQKYTPLSSPIPVPAKISRLSNRGCRSRSTVTPNRKIAIETATSTPIELRDLKADRSKKSDVKPVLLVFFMSYRKYVVVVSFSELNGR